MSGFSIYLLFITAGLIAAPRRVSWFAVLVAITVSAYSFNRDIEGRPPIQNVETSERVMPDQKQADRAAPLSPGRS
ncbi:hypothetical protein [Bradyrhizobium sp. USDA 4486]